MEQKRVLRIVLASPGDVQAERDALPAVLDELNRGIAAERNLVLELHRWETDSYPGFHPEGPQGLIDPTLKIEDCDILVGIFWKRFGTPTHDAQSGTEHEILRAYAAWQQSGRPQIMVYFNQKGYSPKSKDETDQWGKVLDFQLRFPKEGLWVSYKGKAQFERLVRTHLTNLIRAQYPRPIQTGAATERLRQDAPGRATEELTKEYLAGLAGRVSTVYIFGEDEPRALDKVFVELSIVEEYRRPTVHAEFLGLMDAEMRQRRSAFARAEDERGPGDAGGKVKRTVKPDELLRGRTKAVVAGAPGCGKTTLLRYLAWRTHEAQERFPVFLELKTVTAAAFERAQHDLAELLFAEGVAGPLDLGAGERERFREFFMARLAAGEVTIFLDGLDEVSGTDFFPRLCEAVGEFTRRAHSDNTLVISTRPYALQARLEGLKQMEIAPLNQRQIEEFFAHYYGDDPDAQRLLRTLRQRRPLRELLRVPFLLAVVTELYRQQQTVVEDRLELYRQLVWQLVVQSVWVRQEAIQALGRIGGERAIAALRPPLKDWEISVRRSALLALARFNDKEAVAALFPLLNDKYNIVRTDAASVLGELGDLRAVVALLSLLKDESGGVRTRAAEVLGEMDDSVLAVGLVRALEHEDEFVRRKAAQGVGYYAEGEHVLEELARMADEDSSEAVRNAASEARARYERKLAYFAEKQ